MGGDVVAVVLELVEVITHGDGRGVGGESHAVVRAARGRRVARRARAEGAERDAEVDGDDLARGPVPRRLAVRTGPEDLVGRGAAEIRGRRWCRGGTVGARHAQGVGPFAAADIAVTLDDQGVLPGLEPPRDPGLLVQPVGAVAPIVAFVVGAGELDAGAVEMVSGVQPEPGVVRRPLTGREDVVRRFAHRQAVVMLAGAVADDVVGTGGVTVIVPPARQDALPRARWVAPHVRPDAGLVAVGRRGVREAEPHHEHGPRSARGAAGVVEGRGLDAVGLAGQVERRDGCLQVEGASLDGGVAGNDGLGVGGGGGVERDLHLRGAAVDRHCHGIAGLAVARDTRTHMGGGGSGGGGGGGGGEEGG